MAKASRARQAGQVAKKILGEPAAEFSAGFTELGGGGEAPDEAVGAAAPGRRTPLVGPELRVRRQFGQTYAELRKSLLGTGRVPGAGAIGANLAKAETELKAFLNAAGIDTGALWKLRRREIQESLKYISQQAQAIPGLLSKGTKLAKARALQAGAVDAGLVMMLQTYSGAATPAAMVEMEKFKGLASVVKRLPANMTAIQKAIPKGLEAAKGVRDFTWGRILEPGQMMKGAGDILRKHPGLAAVGGVMGLGMAGLSPSAMLEARQEGLEVRGAKEQIAAALLGQMPSTEDYINNIEAEEALMGRAAAIAQNNPEMFVRLANLYSGPGAQAGQAASSQPAGVSRLRAGPAGVPGGGGRSPEEIQRLLEMEFGG